MFYIPTYLNLKEIVVMNILMVLTLLLWTTPSYAWRCGQNCDPWQVDCIAHNEWCKAKQQIDVVINPPLPVPIGRDNIGSLVCIFNASNNPITYFFRWGNSASERRIVYPNNGIKHWWAYHAINENTAPPVSVKYDWNTTQEGVQRKLYTLRSWSQSEQNCNKQGVIEEFFQSKNTNAGETIEIFNRQK
jgi:hypothetical protein